MSKDHCFSGGEKQQFNTSSCDWADLSSGALQPRSRIKELRCLGYSKFGIIGRGVMDQGQKTEALLENEVYTFWKEKGEDGKEWIRV